MIQKNTKMRILFNDAHANLPKSNTIPQGGVSSFASKFTQKFEKETELISILFSHNLLNSNIYIKKTMGNHFFYELFYNREILAKSYKKIYTKKKYVNFLEPWLETLDTLIKEVKPDVVFLNGFSLSNWLILEASYRNKIPVCIQHAGIWKVELKTAQNHFSSSIKKIFSSFERDNFKKANIQIFLNEYSRDVFFDIHSIKKNKDNFNKTQIVPLPINTNIFKKIKISKHLLNIGVVARWDRIKNHDAILRLAKYIKKNKLPIRINVVTSWDPNSTTIYREEYKKLINIIKPMLPIKLNDFYTSQDLILIPSRFDVSPTVLMESLLVGKPVIISSSVGWVSDYKKFELNRLILKPKDSGEKIYNTIMTLFNNSKIYENKFTKLQNKIINKHNTNIVFKKYLDIFIKLIK